LQELHQAGLRVPDDISVIGFDDSIEDMLTPPLSSVGRPLQEMGVVALDLAIATITDPERQSIRFPTHLVQRNSAA
jgi:DNA-binding LacI/PurR family transcriptional regulator